MEHREFSEWVNEKNGQNALPALMSRKTYVSYGSDGQVQRVGQKFALIAAAGELCISLGILPWEPDSVSAACASVYCEWKNRRGGDVAYEVQEAERRLRLLIAQHGSSRFEAAWGCRTTNDYTAVQEARIINRAGFKRLNETQEWEYYILPDSRLTPLTPATPVSYMAKPAGCMNPDELLPSLTGFDQCGFYQTGRVLEVIADIDTKGAGGLYHGGMVTGFHLMNLAPVGFPVHALGFGRSAIDRTMPSELPVDALRLGEKPAMQGFFL